MLRQEGQMAVADEVGRLMHGSELSRGEFASRIRTSTSRFSTYATEKATSSAVLMVRVRRIRRGGNQSGRPLFEVAIDVI